MNAHLAENGSGQGDRNIRVLIADDHFVVRQGVKALLENEPDCEVVGEAATGHDVVEKAVVLEPEVAVIDVRMPELNGLEATRQIRRRTSKTQIVALTAHDSDEIVQDLLQAGALGYVLKTDAARDLVIAVRAVAEGRPFFTLTVTKLVLQGYLEFRRRTEGPLTPRERETVQLLAEGRSNKEVARALGISVKTAETHRASVMRALHLRSVADLVRYAVRQNIIAA
jgi:DNA-binding NarL/FixJ family response regulator